MMRYITYIKYALTLACLIFIILLCTSDPSSKAAMEDVENAVVKSVDMTGLSKQPNKMIKRLYGLMPEEYEGMSLYTADFGMDVEEVLVVKLKDTNQQDAVVAAMEARVASQLESFDGYGVDQCALLKKNIIEVRGNYILLIVHTDGITAQKAFKDSL